jgi:PAS domain S-box-containing protein
MNQKTSRVILFLSTYRGRLWLLFLIIILALLISFYSIYQVTKKNVIEDAERDASNIADYIARDVERLLEQSHILLTSLGTNKALQGKNCSSILQQTLSVTSVAVRYSGLAVLDQKGRVTCSTYGADAVGKDLQALDIVDNAALPGELLVGEVRHGELSGNQLIPVAIRVLREDTPPFFIVVSVELSTFTKMLEGQPSRSFSAAFIINGQGRVVAASHPSGPTYWFNRYVNQSEIFQEMHKMKKGTGLGPGLDGIKRIYAFNRLQLNGAHLHILTTTEEAALIYNFFGKVNGPMIISLVAMLLFCLLMMLLVYVFYAKSIKNMMSTVAELSEELLTELNTSVHHSGSWSGNLKEVQQVISHLESVKELLLERTRQLQLTQRNANLISWSYDSLSKKFTCSGPIQLVIPEIEGEAHTLEELYKHLNLREEEMFDSALERLCKQHEPLSLVLEVTLQGSDGEVIRHLKIHGEVVKVMHNEQAKFKGFIQNVSGYVAVTKELDRKDKFLNALLDNMNESVVACNAEGTIEVFNSVTSSIHQKPYSTISIKDAPSYYNIYDAAGETLLEPEKLPLYRAWQGEQLSEEFITIIPENQPAKTVVVRGQPIIDSEGKRLGAVVIQSDVTDKLAKESEIKKQDEQLRAIFNSSLDGLLLCDKSGRILRQNEAVFSLVGEITEPDCSGAVARLLGDAQWQEIEQKMSDRMPTNIYSAEVIVNNGAHHDNNVELLCTNISIDNEESLLLVFRDISQRKREEEQNIAMQRVEAITQLTGGIAHDFNNLLQVILMNLDLLECELEGNTELLPYVEASLKAADKGGVLTTHLLSFTKQQSMAFEVIELNKMFSEFSEFLFALFDKKHHIEIRCCDSPLNINVDKPQLEVAITQIVMNACEAIEKRGKISIELIRREEKSSTGGKEGLACCIVVSDSGIGMSEETRERAVEPFFSTKKIGNGPGLGLSMVYGFMQQCNGSLEIESQLGKGTRVTLAFPAV